MTPHVSIAGVDAGITRANVVEAGGLLDRVLPESGLGPPRIGVCRTQSARGGRENGRFGRHELGVIGPAIGDLVGEGIDVTGPTRPTRSSCGPRRVTSTAS